MWPWYLQRMPIRLYCTWPLCSIEASGPVFFLEFVLSFDFSHYISLFAFLFHCSKHFSMFSKTIFFFVHWKNVDVGGSIYSLFYSSRQFDWISWYQPPPIGWQVSIFLGQVFLELLVHKSVYWMSSTERPIKCFQLKASKTELIFSAKLFHLWDSHCL